MILLKVHSLLRQIFLISDIFNVSMLEIRQLVLSILGENALTEYFVAFPGTLRINGRLDSSLYQTH